MCNSQDSTIAQCGDIQYMQHVHTHKQNIEEKINPNTKMEASNVLVLSKTLKQMF